MDYKTPKKTGDMTPISMSQFDGKCICQICTCGKDRCPPKSVHVDPSHFDTTNKKAYQTWEIKRITKIKKEDTKPINFGSQSFVSSYNRDYTPQKQMDNRSNYKPQEQFYSQPFTGDSEYHQQFKKIQQYSTPIKQQYQYQPKTEQQTFYKSTYKQNYSPQPIIRSQFIKPQEYNFTPNSLQFQTKSNYQEQYTPQKPIRSEPIKQSSIKPIGGMLMEKYSLYQQEFPAYDLKSYQKAECPIRQLPKATKNQSPNQHLVFSSAKKQWE